ncbi:helix-turn-helix domain-containing protein [Mycobacterium sp. MBM]|nr:helix-turn-helix domain-containing protein [Mycobacterium sp. MBM]
MAVPKLVTLEQAAGELAVSPRSVRRYLASGLLVGVRVGPRLIRITRESLDRMLTPVGSAA